MRLQNPQLTILRVTGFGQTGPDKRRPGFARVFEALSGYTYMSGHPDKPPTYNGYPIGDAVAGLFGALGILSAVHHQRENPDSPGQDIDLSATEAMLRILDFLPIEYDQLGIVRERSGNSSAYAAPVNTYQTQDGKWLSLHAGMQPMWERFARVMGRADMLTDPAYATNENRVQNMKKLDPTIAQWIAGQDYAQIAALLTAADIPHCPIYSIADVFTDPQFAARESIVQVTDRQLGPVKMQCVVPRFSATPGSVRDTGPDLGQDNEAVFTSLGLSKAQIDALRARGVL